MLILFLCLCIVARQIATVVAQNGLDAESTKPLGSIYPANGNSLHHGITIVLKNQSSNSLTIQLLCSNHSVDIKLFDIVYAESTDISPGQSFTFDSIVNTKTYMRTYAYIERGRNSTTLHLYNLLPGRSYSACARDAEIGNNIYGCVSDLSTGNYSGEIKYLHSSKGDEPSQVLIKWTTTEFKKYYDKMITYEVCCKYNSTDDDRNQTVETWCQFDRQEGPWRGGETRGDNNCTEIIGNINEFVNVSLPVDSVYEKTVCVKLLYEDGEECIKIPGNATNDMDEVTISLEEGSLTINGTKGSKSYIVDAICYDAPLCKLTADDCKLKDICRDPSDCKLTPSEIEAPYRILVYGDRNRKNLLETEIYYPQDEEHEKNLEIISTDTSISTKWTRPWSMKDLVDIKYSVVGNESNEIIKEFKKFVGCSLSVLTTKLNPYNEYNVTFKVAQLQSRTPGDQPQEEKDYSKIIITKPGVCEKVTDIKLHIEDFGNRDYQFPTATFDLPKNRTGVIDSIIIEIQSMNGNYQESKQAFNLTNEPELCNNGTGPCSIPLRYQVIPNTNYTVTVFCGNKDYKNSVGIRHSVPFKTGYKVPKFDDKETLIKFVDHAWNSWTHGLKIILYYTHLDHKAGKINYVNLYYGKEEDLPSIAITGKNGFINETENSPIHFPGCLNITISKFDLEMVKTPFIEKDLHLKASTNYILFLKYDNGYGYEVTKAHYFRSQENRDPVIPSLCFIIVVFIILTILSIYFSRGEKSCPTIPNVPELDFNPPSLTSEEFHHPIFKHTWKEQLEKLLKEPKMEIKKEFFSLSQKVIHGGTFPPSSEAEDEPNVAKNRYCDIIPYDFSRVVLQDRPEINFDDYINATYMHSYNVNCGFIACQGPKENTVNEFWRMILEKNARVIVMLTKLIEGREKCFKYWPNSISPLTTSSKISVKLIEEKHDPSGDYTIRKFFVSQGWESMDVVQFHFTAWPDKCCPKTANFFSFIHEVKACVLDNYPVVVHCSAGVGRTGAFIALYNLLDEMHDEETDYVDIYYQVLKMRCFRNYMVQTQSQYIFLYESILQLFQDKTGTLVENDSQDRMSDYEDMSEEEESGIGIAL